MYRFAFAAVMTWVLHFGAVNPAQAQLRIEDTPNRVRAVDWSPDGSMIALGGGPVVCDPDHPEQFAVIVLDAETRNVLHEFVGHECKVFSVAWNKDSTLLATAGTGNGLVWNIETNQVVTTITNSRGRTSLAWSPDNTQIASVKLNDSFFDLTDIETSVEITRLFGSTHQTFSIAWQPHGDLIASGGLGRDIQVVNPYTHEVATMLVGHTDAVTDVAWNPAGTRLVSVGLDGKIFIWNLAGRAMEHAMNGVEYPSNVVWHPCGNAILVSSRAGYVRIYDTQTGDEMATFISEVGPVDDVDWSPDGQSFVYVGVHTGIHGEALQIVNVADSFEACDLD